MRNPLLVPELMELLDEGRHEDLVEVLGDLHPNDAAAILSAIDEQRLPEIMSLLPIRMERDIFGYLEPDAQEGIIRGSGRERVKALLAAMPSDDRAEFLDVLDERVREQMLPLLTQAMRQDLLQRQRYDEDQVGSILSTEFCALRPDLTAGEAIAELRRQEPTKETIYYIYVVDGEGRLLGFTTLRKLIMARADEPIEELLKTDVVSIRANADQEEAAKTISEYDLLALPVVDAQHRLVGIVTHDDAVDILQEEETEDVERMAGVTGETEATGYLDETVFSQIRRRGPLILFLAVFFVITAKIIEHFKGDLSKSGILTALLPMVMATGGMVGVQASALIIRAMTVGKLGPAELLTVLWKELRVSAILGVGLGLVVFGEAWLLNWFSAEPHNTTQIWTISFALATAMGLHVASAALFGALIPLLAGLMKRDPAMMSPAVTALADLSGATIYLATASWMLSGLF